MIWFFGNLGVIVKLKFVSVVIGRFNVKVNLRGCVWIVLYIDM